MKVKLDENLPFAQVALLQEHGHEARTVLDQGLGGEDDRPLWAIVRREERFLITADLDFSDLRVYPPGTHAGILVVRPHRQGWRAMYSIVSNVLARHSLDALAGCLVIADEHRIRVRTA